MAGKFNFKKKTNDEINIILLGESGVGKSTFINALCNYFHFNDFDEARAGKMEIVIPAFFTITDEKFEEIRIKIGDDDNEKDDTGKAATQNAKTHKLRMKDYVVNIIDTPGIGDADGYKKDKENFDNTIKYMSNYKRLNGICILLKPNNARLDLHFRYCFKELLIHLHKKAAPNIVFCFTNTRGTFYRPGDSLPPLKKLIQDVENESGIKIPISEKNMFCFDNESFRFLAALKQGVKFDQTDIEDFSRSWKKSVTSSLDMMEYITNLPFHETFDTIKLNEAKKILNELSKPIAELSQNIQTNKKLADDKKKELEQIDASNLGNMSLKDLEKKLYIEQIDFERVPLNMPRTVCTDHSCTRKIKVGSIEKIDYKTHCHPVCYLEGITAECIGDTKLINCDAMKGQEHCTVCGHHYQLHMHIMYENIEKSEQVIDTSIQSMIDQKKDKKRILQDALKSIDDLLKQLDKEQKEIIQISAKFASFLKQHAIIVFNDDLDAYLDLLIREEEGKKQAGAKNDKILNGLRDVKRNYVEEKKIFDQALKAGKSNALVDVSEIDNLIDEMCNLPLSGDKLKNVVDDIRRTKPKKK